MPLTRPLSVSTALMEEDDEMLRMCAAAVVAAGSHRSKRIMCRS